MFLILHKEFFIKTHNKSKEILNEKINELINK